MTHILCPKCNTREHVTGYGFGAGCFGGYTICECGAILELRPDCDDLPDEEIIQSNRRAEQILRITWGDEWHKYAVLPDIESLSV